MAEVILTADRVTLNEAKKMSKDLIGETAPEFILMDDEGNEFDSRSLDGEWRILFFSSLFSQCIWIILHQEFNSFNVS